jgi:tRNA(adenine34) deaminase
MTHFDSDFSNPYMKIALDEARLAYSQGEIPVGCVVVDRLTGSIVSIAHNMSEQDKNPNLHAEMIAIDRACKKINNKFLLNCDIYITLEPCTMCSSAISNARIARIYYAASDEKQGAVENGIRFYTTDSCFHRPEIYSGIHKFESEELITSFFSKLRKSKL